MLLKGSERSAVSKNGQTAIDMIKDSLEEHMQEELVIMLKEPVYLECFMRRVPLKPIRPNLRTQMLFIIFFIFIITGQLLVILPSKSAFNECL